ncbi:MAG: hypothetical protein CMC15_15205 [Flavobacteriaceae bacterium]|nr:hypothetical protein [Flavobacteriaceae bacterium]
MSEKEDLDISFAKIFATPSGQNVLSYLRKRTIEQPGWIPGSDSSNGYFHEGKCSIVREIEVRIEKGRNRS